MKPFPPLESDEEAEEFVATADLTEYDPSEMVTMDLERTTGSETIVLSDALLVASREKAAHLGIALESFVRSAIERALRAD